MSLEGEKLQVLKSIDKNLSEMKTAVVIPSEAQIRAVALVAAALAPNPGGTPLYERADEHAKYIREGVVGNPDEAV